MKKTKTQSDIQTVWKLCKNDLYSNTTTVFTLLKVKNVYKWNFETKNDGTGFVVDCGSSLKDMITPHARNWWKKKIKEGYRRIE